MKSETSHRTPESRSSRSYLVPEKQIGLTKLKLLYVKLLHERKSHDIEAREDPTSPYWKKAKKILRYIQVSKNLACE